MRKLAVIVASLTIAVAVMAVSSSSAGQAGATFTALTESITREAGRIEISSAIRDRHGDKVGRGVMICWVFGNQTQQCLGTYILPLGKISVSGSRLDQDFFILAVTGGTGFYHGATGSMVGRLIKVSPHVERLFFELILP